MTLKEKIKFFAYHSETNLLFTIIVVVIIIIGLADLVTFLARLVVGL